ncbi:hypothetical protein HBA55_04995 [Pseudomaricurvus alkylphenolicus]|jgi:acyl dehydratase|uniref:MaoC/PaaZ C-terminal domain-containing protein n=1 Tax=Pseudomaricurvus alkylphenolicus TaxID=1306991 RepID=UPI00141F6EA5|nr:MaoC/PaaZ C-terminal domain-containing protein [Pseudomaricurvus alkylphenolicus]NIB38931.1 hypothetical protein [Pseudomaricurvus alkylphenolicus]
MTADVHNLCLGDIHVGQSLPPLEHEVTATTVVLGAMASRDWRPMHHDRDFAINRNGARDIFLNTPNQAAWLERLITDWSGPKGRLGAMRFQMKTSVYPGDRMRLTGKVTEISPTEWGYGWVAMELAIHVGSRQATSCQASVAIAVDQHNNPWLSPIRLEKVSM